MGRFLGIVSFFVLTLIVFVLFGAYTYSVIMGEVRWNFCFFDVGFLWAFILFLVIFGGFKIFCKKEKKLIRKDE